MAAGAGDAAGRTVQAAAFRDVFNAFYQLVLEARNERLARIREQWPKLPPLTVDGCDLLDHAAGRRLHHREFRPPCRTGWT